LTLNPSITSFERKSAFGVKAALAFLGKLALLGIWIGASSSSHGLQLGKHRGAAVIGQPLNVTIQATIDSPDELAAGCLDADVFYSDNRLEKSRVRVSSEKAATGPQDYVIRVRSTIGIDEPVVTIYLRTGCAQKIEKRYVVLADVISESAGGGFAALPAMSAPARVPGAAPQGDSSAQPRLAQNAARDAREAQRVAREAKREDLNNRAAAARLAQNSTTISRPPGAPIDARTGESVSPESVAAAPAPRAEKAQNKPAIPGAKSIPADKAKSRLKLEPIDLLAERDPSLKPSAELRTVPTNDPAQRSAAAALWRAIAAQPEDILGDSVKLKTLESAVSGLQFQMKKSQLEMQDFGENIKKAEAEKYANPLVYGLSFLLFLAALGLVITFRKRSAQVSSDSYVQPWWRKGAGQQVGWADSAEALKSSSPTTGFEVDRSSTSGNFDGPSISYLDLDLSEVGNKVRSKTGSVSREEASLLESRSGVRPAPVSEDPTINLRADFAQSMSFAGRAVKAEELFDVQQQADFFVSLGQKDQAIEVLRSHIEESEETSALVYLDLLKLYHQLNEKLEFEAFRQEFNARFNAEIPEFEAYSEAASGEGLQGYPIAMSRIVALWPSAKVLNVIEESMFRQPDSQITTFDLEAYRELLLLYAMIKDILHAQSVGKGPTLLSAPRRSAIGIQAAAGSEAELKSGAAHERAPQFPSTSVVPLSATPEKPTPNSAFDVDMDVDVDLSSLGRPGRPESATATLTNMQPTNDALEAAGGAANALTSPAVKANLTISENSIDFDFDLPAKAELPAQRLVSRPPPSKS
jgi:hypothetical protein